MSLLGKCAGCAAKDDEIAYLRSQNKQLTDKVVNLVDPALEARQAYARRLAEQPVRPQNEEPATRISPGYIRRTRRDGGAPVPPKTAAQVEASFKRAES